MEAVTIVAGGIPQPKGSTKAMIHPFVKNMLQKGMPWWQLQKIMATRRIPETVTMTAAAGLKQWADALANFAKREAVQSCPWKGPVCLQVAFFLPKSKGYPKTRDLYHTVKPDIDKLTRAIGDVLTGIIYHDDAQVVQMNVSKEYGNEPEVIITVYRLPGEGKDERKKPVRQDVNGVLLK